MVNQKFIKNAAGILISTGLVIWLYFSIQWQEVWTQLQNINYLALIPYTILIVVHFYVRALRWRYLLPETEKKPGINELFDCIMMGNLATYILPLRAGEFIRPYLLTYFSSYNFSTVFSSVIVERFFDLATVLLTFAYVVTQVDDLPVFAERGAYILGIMAIGILTFIIVGSMLPKVVLNIVSKSIFFLPQGFREKILKFLEDLLVSAQVISNFKTMLIIVVLSAVTWAICYFFTYVGLFMFEGDFTILMALTLSVVVALAVAAPSAPGFIGVYQTASIAGFAIFGFSSEMAVTYSIVTHLLNYILFGICAVIFCVRNDMKFSTVLKIKK